MDRPFVLLAFAIACEVTWAVMLKASRGFTVVWASSAMMMAYTLSLVFLSMACQHFEVSRAYAVWTGSGAAMVALIGVMVFGEPINWMRFLGFALVTAGVVVLLGFEVSPT